MVRLIAITDKSQSKTAFRIIAAAQQLHIQSLFKGQQVMSIEDPVEIKQDDMLQLQLNEAIGLTYENLIKLSLRHRPDLLIIGEIRDSETARAVVRASLTGATANSSSLTPNSSRRS